MDSIDARRAEALRLLRLYAVPEDAEAEVVEAPRHAVLPAPQRRGDRVARASPVLARRAHRARSSRRGCRATARACRCSSTCRTSRSCSRVSPGFFGRAGLSIYDAKIHTTRAGRALDTFTLNDPAQRGGSYRETLSMVERSSRASWPAGAADAACGGPHVAAREAFPAYARGAGLRRRQGHALHPRESSPRTGPACSRASPTRSRRRT